MTSSWLHWIGVLACVPLILLANAFPNPERMKALDGKTAVPAPKAVVGICSCLVHLTMTSVALNAAYFSLALLQDYELLAVAWLDEYFTIVLTIALFVAMVYWASVVVNPALMLDPLEIFEGYISDPANPPPWVPRVLFQMCFGPATLEHATSQIGFRLFMLFLHTFIPGLVFADAALLDHHLRTLDFEASAVVGSFLVYLGWNLFCWWLLRRPPYPLQKRLWDFGGWRTILSYLILLVVAVVLLLYSRALRVATDVHSWSMVSPPILCIVWASCGFFPFRERFAKLQGLNPDEIWVKAKAK